MIDASNGEVPGTGRQKRGDNQGGGAAPWAASTGGGSRAVAQHATAQPSAGQRGAAHRVYALGMAWREMRSSAPSDTSKSDSCCSICARSQTDRLVLRGRGGAGPRRGKLWSDSTRAAGWTRNQSNRGRQVE
jgi:hypothetical protein